MNKKTRLVNLNHNPCEYDIYIGRYNHSKNLPQSKWHNPFKLKDYDFDRNKVIELYREYIMNSPELLKDLPELKGKVLCCWCTPMRCHGDVLIDLLDNQTKITDYFDIANLKISEIHIDIGSESEGSSEEPSVLRSCSSEK